MSNHERQRLLSINSDADLEDLEHDLLVGLDEAPVPPLANGFGNGFSNMDASAAGSASAVLPATRSMKDFVAPGSKRHKSGRVCQCASHSTAQVTQFLLAMGLAYQRSGMPAHVLEHRIGQLAAHYGVTASLFVTPINTIFSFSSPGSTAPATTHIVHVSGSAFNIDSIELLHKVCALLCSGRVSIGKACQLVEAVMARPPRYGLAFTFLSYIVSSFAIVIFFGGGWHEAMASLAIGLMAFLVSLIKPLALAAPAISTFIGAFFSVVYCDWVEPVNVFTTTLSGVIILVPGLSLTISMVEIATGHIVSGTTRLALALVVELEFAYGLILGLRVASLIFHVDDVTPSDPINLGFFPLFALLAGWAFCTDCQLPPGRMPIGLFTSLVGAVFSLFVIPLLGDMAGTLLGGLVLGLISNLYARLFKPHISLTALIPGILMLVPGSLGVRGLSTISLGDPVAGFGFVMLMFLVALQLSVAMILSNAFIPVKGTRMPWFALCDNIRSRGWKATLLGVDVFSTHTEMLNELLLADVEQPLADG